MKKTIKLGEKLGIAKQAQGHTVDVIPHPKYKGMWQFEFQGEMWIASNYAFNEEE